MKSALICLASLILVLTAASNTCASSITVQVDTSALEQSSSGPFQLAFALVDASGAGDANNTASLTSFSLGGGATKSS